MAQTGTIGAQSIQPGSSPVRNRWVQLVVGIIGTFQVFTQSYVMTNGGPQDQTRPWIRISGVTYMERRRVANMEFAIKWNGSTRMA